MNPLLADIFRDFARVIAAEVAKNLAKDTVDKLTTEVKEKKGRKKATPAPAANDDDGATGAGSMSAVASLPPSVIREECLAIINKLAPTHGPQLRAALAAVGGARLRDIADDRLVELFDELTGLQNAS
ncbi:TPA: hypothetical protein OMU21_004964 [Klebsiella aerogenes]|nr:hypothetical protein [Klebsiella aerogenes]